MSLQIRKPSRAVAIKIACYAAVIASIATPAAWVYYHRHPTHLPPPPEPPEPSPVAPAGPDPRTALALEQELLAPAAFPWSWPALSRLGRAEVKKLVFTRPPRREETDRITADLRLDLEKQIPTLARPFTLPSSPPYLLTPATLELEFELDPEGYVAAAGVSGASADVNAVMAERALDLVFSRDAGEATFQATVVLTPYHYGRLTALRGGRPLTDEDYRRLLRALQFNSFPLYGAVTSEQPELYTARGPTRVSFTIGPEGEARDITFTPPLPPSRSVRIITALEKERFPVSLKGTKASFLVGPPPAYGPAQ